MTWDQILDFIEAKGVWELKADHPEAYAQWSKEMDKRHDKKVKELYGRVPRGKKGWAREKNSYDRRKRLGLIEQATSRLDGFGIPIFEEIVPVRELLVEGVEANDAIVHFPVTIAGESKNAEGVPYHVTLRWGKWDEPKAELIAAVKEATSKLDTSRPEIKHWRPEIFKGKDGDKEFHVLAFDSTPALNKLRVALAPVFGPDPFPEFRPHISVDKALWSKIRTEKLLPSDIGVEVKPLELAMGNSTLEQLGESEELSEAIVYHGSPRAFDKFTLDYAGETQGTAIAYGLYFSEAPEGASFYRQLGKGNGKLYKVKIPDGPYLEWDKSLSAQPKIQKLLKNTKAYKDADDRHVGGGFLSGAQLNGREYYHGMAHYQDLSPEEVSRFLLGLGIKGVKYKHDSYVNYVLFDADDAKILKTEESLNETRTKEISINGEKVEATLMAGGPGFKIYSGLGGLLVVGGGKKLLFKENDPAFKGVMKYVNLRYQHASDKDAVIKNFHQILVDHGIKKSPVEEGLNGDWEDAGVVFSIEKDSGKGIIITATKGEEVVGIMEVSPSEAEKGKLYPINVNVQDKFKRMGIATEMYRLAEKHFGMTFTKGHYQSPEAKRFRKSYDSKNEAKKSDLAFRMEEEDDGFTIIASKDGVDAGNIFVTLEFIDSDCYAFEPYAEEPFHDEICNNENVVNIQHLQVSKEFQGQGIATELMKKAGAEIKKRWSGLPAYINASPMDGPTGISLDALVKFYQRFGFKMLKKYPKFRNALLFKEEFDAFGLPILLTVSQGLHGHSVISVMNSGIGNGNDFAIMESVCPESKKLSKVSQVSPGPENGLRRQSSQKSFNESTLINMDLSFLSRLAQNTMPQFSLSKNLVLVNIFEKHLDDVVSYRIHVIEDGLDKTYKIAVTAGGLASVGSDVRHALEKYTVILITPNGELGHLDESCLFDKFGMPIFAGDV